MSPVGVVEVYRDADGQWRWRRQALNNRIVATSGEGYHNRDDAADMAAKEAIAHGAELVIIADGEPDG